MTQNWIGELHVQMHTGKKDRKTEIPPGVQSPVAAALQNYMSNLVCKCTERRKTEIENWKKKESRFRDSETKKMKTEMRLVLKHQLGNLIRKNANAFYINYWPKLNQIGD